MIKLIKWILLEIVLFSLVLTGAIAVVTQYVRPYMQARTKFAEKEPIVLQQTISGDIQVVWPEADQADYYLFEVYQLPYNGSFTHQNSAGELIATYEISEGTSILFPVDAFSGNVMFRIHSAVGYLLSGEPKVRFCIEPLEVVVNFDLPVVQALTYTADQQRQRATVKMEALDVSHFVIYYKDTNGEYQQWKTVSAPTISLSFGDEGDFALPRFEESLHLKVAVYRKGDGFVYYSGSYAEISIPREELVPADFSLSVETQEDGYHLSWEKKECDYYDIQILNSLTQKWNSITHVEGDADPTYIMALDSVDDACVLRVVAAYQKEEKGENGEITMVEKYRAISNEIVVPPAQALPLPGVE